MSRTLSSSVLAAIYADETAELFIILLEISHSTLASSIKITSDSQNTTHNSNTYLPFPFKITLPNDDENQPPRMQITIDNIDRSIISALRTIPDAASITVKVVTFDTPDTIEIQYSNFQLYVVNYDAFTISGTLSLEPFLNEGYPKGKMGPNAFPGIF